MMYYIKKHWKINLLIIILQIAWAATMVFPNVAMMKLTQGIVERKPDVFIFWTAVNLGIFSLGCVLECIRSWAKSKAIQNMNNDVRADISASILKSEHRDFHTKQSGEHLSRLTNDVTQIQSLAWEPFYGIVSLVAQVIFSVVILGQMHWSLLLISAIVSVVMLFIPQLGGNRMGKLSENFANVQGLAMSKLKDLIAGMDVLRSFGKQSRFMKDSGDASNQIEQARHKFTCTKTVISEGIGWLNILCQMGINLAIGILSIQGVIISTAIIGGGNLVGTISSGLSTVAQRFLSIKASKPYFEKITVRANALNSRVGTASAPMEEAITVESLSFSYGDKPVLENADFRFKKGGKYALTGPSGCGKSTLLKLLLGWLPEYSGTIRFDGRNTKDFTTEELQQQMSYIEQDVFLFNTTIRDNITLGENFTDEMIDRAVKGSALDSDLANMPLGLDTPVGEDGSNLSGGQKQRVAIARALIHNRSILLVDEGTSALDQKNADIVEESLLGNPDLTLILVSHHLTPERKAQFTKVFELQPVLSSISATGEVTA